MERMSSGQTSRVSRSPELSLRPGSQQDAQQKKPKRSWQSMYERGLAFLDKHEQKVQKTAEEIEAGIEAKRPD